MKSTSISLSKVNNQIKQKVPQQIAERIIQQKVTIKISQNQKLLFIQNVGDIQLCLNYLIHKNLASFSIIPIEINGQVLKIKTKKQIIQINRKIIALNKFCNTWRFKINPKNGNFYLVYQCFKFSSDNLNANFIIKSYFQAGLAKVQFTSIIFEISKNQTFAQEVPKILKYAANSNKYTWGIKKCQQKIKNQKWQTQSCESNSQNENETIQQQLKQNKVQNLQKMNDQNKCSKLSLYQKTKKSYNQLPILLKQANWNNNKPNFTKLNYNKELIITQQEDIRIYNQQLSFFHNKINNIIKSKQNGNCENEDSTTDIDSTLQSHLEEQQQQEQQLQKQQVEREKQNFSKQNDTKYKYIKLKHYLKSNRETLSKKTLWNIIVNLLTQYVKKMYSDTQILFKQNKPLDFTIHKGLSIQLGSFYQSFMFLNCEGEYSSIDSQNIQEDQIQIQRRISVKLIIGKTFRVDLKLHQVTKYINILNQININSESQTSYFQNWKDVVELIMNQFDLGYFIRSFYHNQLLVNHSLYRLDYFNIKLYFLKLFQVFLNNLSIQLIQVNKISCILKTFKQILPIQHKTLQKQIIKQKVNQKKINYQTSKVNQKKKHLIFINFNKFYFILIREHFNINIIDNYNLKRFMAQYQIKNNKNTYFQIQRVKFKPQVHKMQIILFIFKQKIIKQQLTFYRLNLINIKIYVQKPKMSL